MMKHLSNVFLKTPLILIGLVAIIIFEYGCGASPAGNPMANMPPQLPVVTVITTNASTYREFPASLEGKVNVEIRAQVDGYLEKIYVDEGAYVKAGQPLFKINDNTYREQLNNAQSTLSAAEANVQRAQVEIDRLTPLVQNNVISDVQLKTAKANYDAAKASAEQAKAMIGNAQINVGYTLIKAPVSGYIGRIPYKTGSLVGRNEDLPLTMLSDVSEVYAYFSMSEQDFIAFKNQFAGNSIEEKLKQVPPVELILPDDSTYMQKGKIGTVEGQFDKATGSISFRATFPNAGGVLRSGNTGKIRIPELLQSALVVPQEATFEIQDKTFVYAVGDSNKIVTKPIVISGRTTNYYYVSNGVTAGEKIVLSSQSTLLMGGLRDGMPITPQMVSTDSLMKVKPL